MSNKSQSSTIQKIINFVLDIIYPPKCIFCKTILSPGTEVQICTECYEKIPFISNQITCEICGQPLDTIYGQEKCMDCRKKQPCFEQSTSPCEYTGIIRKAIVNFKFYGKKHYAKTLGRLMVEHLKEIQTIPIVHIIVYTPLHPKRLLERGYNQAELLAKVVGKELNCPVGKDVIRKVKNTPPQSHLSRQERLKNLQGAFQLNPKVNLKGLTILLVDDVYTTGATVDACAKLLKESGGAVQVYVVTAAVGKGIN